MFEKIFGKTTRAYYIGLFIVFGLAIAFFTSLVNYRLEINSIEAKLSEQALAEFKVKLGELEDFTYGIEYIVSALRDNSLLSTYLLDPDTAHYKSAVALFTAVAGSNQDIMQVRFLDTEGREKIRIDWDNGRDRPSVVPVEKLQDKSQRSYYLEPSQLSPNFFWYSKLGLNRENGKIEVPHKPVLRIASPVYVDRQYRGVVVVNLHAQDLLFSLRKSSVFDVCLIDKDGYYLTGHLKEHNWARYLGGEKILETVYQQRFKEILYGNSDDLLRKVGDIFVGSVDCILEKDGGLLVFHTKPATLKDLERERRKGAFVILGVILLLSVPLAFVISRRPAKLYKKIEEQNSILTEYIDVIDKNIHTCSIDREGNVQEVSTAFAQTVGFTKSSIVGSKYSQVYCKTRPKEYYDEVWQTVDSGDKWVGELQHSKADGNCYWSDTVALPKFNSQGDIVGYSVIHQDITDKKRIEELAITDVMTGLYNRRYFNTVILDELNRSRRDKKMLAFAMLDLDFFKQYNDHYGHQKGDQVLRDVADVMKKKLGRGSDFCFRLGGEEFGILFTDHTPELALHFTESVRQAIMKVGIEHQWSEVADVVTVSIGLLSVSPGIGVTVDSIYRMADEALYEAKDLGRNQVIPKILDPQV